ncbi:hypothetical protein GW940_04865 [Candidatus Microgenomates bacterium]|nr:hypothetical protein [Candidatus Microgenomates bacterium]
MATQITKQDFQKYVRVQRSGKTNMFDVAMVESLSGLSRNKIIEIMKNYNEYIKRWKVSPVGA